MLYILFRVVKGKNLMFRICMQPAALSLLIMVNVSLEAFTSSDNQKANINTHYHLLGHLDYKKSLYTVKWY